MALTPQEIEELKEQLKEQISHLPAEKKAQAEAQIESMSPEALESMLQQSQSSGNAKQKPIFRMITDGDVQSSKVDENRQAIAVLEINPISKAHTIIIPKNPINDAKQIPTQAFTLAKKLGKKIVEKLKATSTEIQTEHKFGEAIINLIPIYDKPLNINSPRSKSTPEQLEEIAQKLRPKPKIQKIKIKTEPKKGSQILKLPRRIP